MQNDLGKEFFNAKCKAQMKKHNINHYLFHISTIHSTCTQTPKTPRTTPVSNIILQPLEILINLKPMLATFCTFPKRIATSKNSAKLNGIPNSFVCDTMLQRSTISKIWKIYKSMVFSTLRRSSLSSFQMYILSRRCCKVIDSCMKIGVVFQPAMIPGSSICVTVAVAVADSLRVDSDELGNLRLDSAGARKSSTPVCRTYQRVLAAQEIRDRRGPWPVEGTIPEFTWSDFGKTIENHNHGDRIDIRTKVLSNASPEYNRRSSLARHQCCSNATFGDTCGMGIRLQLWFGKKLLLSCWGRQQEKPAKPTEPHSGIKTPSIIQIRQRIDATINRLNRTVSGTEQGANSQICRARNLVCEAFRYCHRDFPAAAQSRMTHEERLWDTSDAPHSQKTGR
ncbi:hypothetical protein PR048_004636 [Dryococelus australis]|uniref:Uncharacterized protein n=1 Tax=Dryococelus australis TaxID=614101 RepID=A0ABQ9I5Y8_9NEOP|nr:hypothetical protein PR048_004636 [Dryococelus australis]